MTADPAIPIKLVGEQTIPPRKLSDQEELALVEAVSRYGTLRDRTILLLHARLRARELCGLRQDQMTLGEWSGHLCIVDTRNHTRSVLLNATVRKALEEYLPRSRRARRGSFFRRRRTTPYQNEHWDISSRNMRAFRRLPMSAHRIYAIALAIAWRQRHSSRSCARAGTCLARYNQTLFCYSNASREECACRCFPSCGAQAASHPAASQIAPPRLPAFCVSRQRLLARLEEGHQGKITVVFAPASFGKTTLVRQRLDMHGQDMQTAWLSLDPEDDDPMRFWHYVLTACVPVVGKPGHDALQQLAPHHPFFTVLYLKQILTSLLNALAEQTSRLLLVLDDYHVITSAQIHESLVYFVDHLPPTLHLVLLTRTEPTLPLARWHARVDLQELHAADLHFSPEDITSFLHQAVPVPLPTEKLQLLDAQIEGWPTGFRLLALALQGKRERKEIEQVLGEFNGSHRYLLDYFVLKVFSSQPETREIFLLQTSLLCRMTASLCDAVTGCRDSEQTLREIERSGLFLQTLGGAPL